MVGRFARQTRFLYKSRPLPGGSILPLYTHKQKQKSHRRKYMQYPADYRLPRR